MAHRIPLYVAPYFLLGRTGEEIGAQIAEATTPAELTAAYNRADKAGEFYPVFGLGTKSPRPVRFDGQMFADFATIEELTQRFFDALEERNGQPAI